MLLFYGIVLGGAHAYLAVRGHDGMVSVQSRWRYVTVVGVLLITGFVILIGGTTTVPGIELGTIGLAVIVITVIGYLVGESMDAYRESRESETT